MATTRIALDAMGGDSAPFAPVKSIEHIVPGRPLAVSLVGDESRVKPLLSRGLAPGCRLIHAERSVGMDEKLSRRMLRDRETSMARVLRMVLDGEADCALSAGNTAGFVSLAISELGLLPGVERPAISIFVPRVTGGKSLLLDVGANVSAKPVHLLQYGIMGALAAGKILGIKEPRVGLLNIGEEEEKGDDLRRDAHRLLSAELGPGFIGNIEGHELLTGKADVIVADGFTGNVVLKGVEGIARAFKSLLRKELMRNVKGKIGAYLLSGHFRSFAKNIDYAEYGGGLLLGVRGVTIISHGRSSPRAIYSAMLLGDTIVREGLLPALSARMGRS